MPERQTRWFSRDADSLRVDLLRYARANYGDKISDFSPASLGGMLLEMAAQVGDSFQFYVDYAFAESQWDAAVETQNIERFLRDVGLIPSGATPSSGEIEITVRVPADPAFEGGKPLESTLPLIKVGTSFRAANGILFSLVENVDFSAKDPNNDLVAEVVDVEIASNGSVAAYFLRKSAIVVSGQEETETFVVGSPAAFRTFTLSKGNVHDIVSVTDDLGRRWFEVDNLAQDTAYIRVRNLSRDRRDVPTLLRTINTTRRFIREYSLVSGRTSLRFGAGVDPKVVDMEDFSVPFRVASVVPFQLDTGLVGRQRSFGEAPANTNLTVVYRHGGGLNHNVPARSISRVNTLEIDFPGTVNSAVINEVVESIIVSNPLATAGGAAALSIEEWRSAIPLARAAQTRMVSQSDIVGWILSMPGEFGRVHRAVTRPSLPGLPTRVWVVCSDKDRLRPATESLKENLKVYLAEQRLIGDAVDVLDCPILNWGMKVRVAAAAGVSKQTLSADLARNLRDYIISLDLKPDQSLDLDRLRARILNTRGVDEIVNFEVIPRVGNFGGLRYSDYPWTNTKKEGKIAPPMGGIFEMLDLNLDVLINVD
jgi:hypothetical protein